MAQSHDSRSSGASGIVECRGSARSGSPFRRLMRVGSWLVYALLAGGVIWLAAARWNGVPADPSGVLNLTRPIDPARDRTQEFTAALAAIPADPPLSLPLPPEGMRWRPTSAPGRTIDVGDATQGAWTPQTRPNLQGVIDFLCSPAVEAAMSRLAAVEPGGWRPAGPAGPGWGNFGLVRRAARLFVARARYRHAGLGDVDGALDDLEAANGVAAITMDSGGWLGVLVGLACRALTDAELRHLAREHRLTADQASRIITSIRSTAPSRRWVWECAANENLRWLRRTLDLSYTDDGRGNGWLVLSREASPRPFAPAVAARSGAWNVLSPLFNDRRAVAAKIARLSDAYEAVADLAYDEARARLAAAEARTPFSITDGPFCRTSPVSQLSRVYELIVQRAAQRHATIVTVALSAWRTDQGEYPTSLADLLEGYLEVLPLDPYVEEPLRYAKQSGDEFLLYSVGPNRVDDGGRRRSGAAGVSGVPRFRRDGDWVFTRPRSDPCYEPALEEVRP